MGADSPSPAFSKTLASSFLSSTTFSSKAIRKSSFAANGFVKWYLHMIDTRPVLTKSVTAASIFTAADITSQVITFAATDATDASSTMEIDVVRTLRMGAYGLLLSGPTLHLWFNFVSTIIPKRDVISTVKKMILGQTVYGPTITAVFFSLNAFLQGESGSEILERLKRDMLPTLKSGLMYWPLCDFLTFRYTPVHLQCILHIWQV
eukprot:TRINITY_DN2671_c0_g1_i2.p1 TRINITY_DN2671_c0_g1~~TRINITY_DN2671_c0_g1_i2.p1  ORF type:complete len:219 (-),score=20.37 TRINITY_DN2671_c0_g1_i2:322-939(-)